jgi:hypothetical protein
MPLKTLGPIGPRAVGERVKKEFRAPGRFNGCQWLEKTSVAIDRKISDEPTREHGGIQYIGQVHEIEIMLLVLVLNFFCEGFLTLYKSHYKF